MKIVDLFGRYLPVRLQLRKELFIDNDHSIVRDWGYGFDISQVVVVVVLDVVIDSVISGGT